MKLTPVLLREFSDLRFIGQTILKFYKERKKAGEWRGSDCCPMYRVVWNTRNASPAKKSPEDKSPVIGWWVLEVRNILKFWNVCSFRFSHSSPEARAKCGWSLHTCGSWTTTFRARLFLGMIRLVLWLKSIY